jgi:16S rRNA C967 or C1407 C5-methylase (RsmB/RsmF family)/NOL1/NOP2/fmu family ribosome biogenesis protein
MEPPVPIPKELTASLEGLPGFDLRAFEEIHTKGPQVTSIRLNPMKRADQVIGVPGVQPVPWSSTGFYLPRRPAFIFDPLLHAGAYYVQEASSMFLEEVLRQQVDLAGSLRVLDLCAAPGGKSTHLQSLISPESLLVSNEVIHTRAGILRENLVKWGGSNVIVSQNDPRDLGMLNDFFDLIVVDAPCSGSGLFRRDPEAIGEWSPENVTLCHQRQQRILADCWPALRAGGILIYSTCSYSRQENEDILDWIVKELQASSCKLQVKKEWGIVETNGQHGGYGYRFYPYSVRGEGLFIACLKKGEDARDPARSSILRRPVKNVVERISRKEESEIRKRLREDQPLFLFRQQELIYAAPLCLEEDLLFLLSKLSVRKAGVCLGQPGAKEFIPDHELALSKLAGPEWPLLPLQKEEAVQYLRKEEIRISGAGLGWARVSFEEQPLGWVKVLHGRINNYYPKQWRILKRDT